MSEVNKEALAAEYERVSKEFHALVCSEYGCGYCDYDLKCRGLDERLIELSKLRRELDARH